MRHLQGEGQHTLGATIAGVNPIKQVLSIGRTLWEGFLWRQLNPATVSLTGLPIHLTSFGNWIAFCEVWVSGEYDEPIRQALDSAQENEPVRIVDLGANIGLFSLRCIELRNQHRPRQPLEIVAVEGVPRTAQIMKDNLSLQTNDITSISPHHGLVGERSGGAQIYDNPFKGANMVVPQNGKTSAMPFRGAHAVAGAYLDLESILPQGVPVNLLKCDIEGSEEVFLRNYPELLARTQYLAIEIHPYHCDPEECRRSLAAARLERQNTFRSSSTMILETYRMAES